MGRSKLGKFQRYSGQSLQAPTAVSAQAGNYLKSPTDPFLKGDEGRPEGRQRPQFVRFALPSRC